MRFGCKGCTYNMGVDSNPYCTDDEEWVDSETGEDVCRYREGAISKDDFLKTMVAGQVSGPLAVLDAS